MAYYDSGEKKEKSPRMTEIAAFVSIVVTIIVAATSLLSNSGNLPSWWFQFSSIVLILLMFSIPVIIFARPINERIKVREDERKRNTISRKYASEFKDIVEKSWNFNSSIYNIFNNLRNHYSDLIKGILSLYVLRSYEQEKIGNTITKIMKDIDESNKTFRELCLINEHFKSILDTFQKSLKIIEVFVHEIVTTTDKPIAKGIENDFEAFREKYNHYINSVNAFYHKINKEIGKYTFPDDIELLKKW